MRGFDLSKRLQSNLNFTKPNAFRNLTVCALNNWINPQTQLKYQYYYRQLREAHPNEPPHDSDQVSWA